MWALNAFKENLGHENQPYVIVTDRELALMNAIKNVFPSTTSLSCVWHIEKNVLAHCRKHFVHIEDFNIFMSSWKNVVYSITEDMFVKNWVEFESFYTDKKDAIEYIKNIWLPWKERFVGAWTENHLHFGSRSTSRVEGAHAKLKQYLQVSTGGFQEVKDKICLAVEHEFNEIKVKLASEKIQVLHDCNTSIFRDLLSRVSHFALKEVHRQYEKIKDGITNPCTGHFMTTMGLPCAHTIQTSIEKTISLELIHPQWRIDSFSLSLDDGSENNNDEKISKLWNEFRTKYEVWPLNKKEYAISMITQLVNQPDMFFEPVIQQPKGRPPKKSKKKKGKTSTTRDPSRFEYVESSRIPNPQIYASTSQTSNEVTYEVSDIPHNNNLIDLNLTPSLSSELMFQ